MSHLNRGQTTFSLPYNFKAFLTQYQPNASPHEGVVIHDQNSRHIYLRSIHSVSR